MTKQQQTDYDKALQKAWNSYVGFTPNGLLEVKGCVARISDKEKLISNK